MLTIDPKVIYDVTLTAPRAGVVAILGRNGAGKTLVGEIAPRSGEIVLYRLALALTLVGD